MPPTPAETWATALLHGWCVTVKFNFIYKTSRRTTRLMCFTSGAVYVKFPAPNTQTSIWNATLKVFAEVIFKPNISERFLSQSFSFVWMVLVFVWRLLNSSSAQRRLSLCALKNFTLCFSVFTASSVVNSVTACREPPSYYPDQKSSSWITPTAINCLQTGNTKHWH